MYVYSTLVGSDSVAHNTLVLIVLYLFLKNIIEIFQNITDLGLDTMYGDGDKIYVD